MGIGKYHAAEKRTAGLAAPVAEEVKPMLREQLFQCDEYGLWRLLGESPLPVGVEGTPRVLVCIAGDGQVEHAGANYSVRKGDVLFLPAGIGACFYRTCGAVCLLEISLPEGS